MRSALLLFVGVVVLTSGAGCDGGSEDPDEGPKAVAGSTGASGSTGTSGSTSVSGSTGSGGSTGTAGSLGMGGDLPAGVPLTIADGWVAGDQNTLGVQGAVFSYADPTSTVGMTEVKTGASYCITGTAAKVDKMSTACKTMMFTPPATDCYGEYWGAAIGMNLNQQIDMTTMEGGMPMVFDGSAIKGFAFEITGTKVPTTMRFKVEGPGGEFCTPSTKPVLLGANSFNLTDLVKECWEPMAATMNPNAETGKSMMVKIAWQVTTKDTMEIPFDYCVTNVRALQ